MTPETDISSEMRKLLDGAPRSPGVYMMKARPRPDAPCSVVYVGMSVNLHDRVRTYFIGSGGGRSACEFIRQSVDDIEFIITDSEKEALLLENVLIKKYRPKYNVLLKDDKTYLSIHVNPLEEWPRLRLVRIRKTPPKGSGKYFGPYASADDCRKMLAVINRLFPLRKCSDANFRNRARPCLYYQIKQCLGPCCNLADRKTYMAVADQVIDMLRGNAQAVIEQQEAEMRRLAEAEQFEQAAVMRDRIRAVQATLEKQKVVKHEPIDRDIFGYHRIGNDILFEVLTVRNGVLSAGKSFPGEAYEFPSEEVFASFITLYYEREGTAVPMEALVPHDFEGRESLEAVLGERKGKKVSIIVPQRGEKLQLVSIAQRNAEAVFKEKHSEEERARSLLDSLQAKLHIHNFPRRIECYDISNIGGTAAVGSMVVFIDGKADKSEYRRFRIKTVDGADDYAMMKEVLSRRLRHSRVEQAMSEEVLAEHWPMPDLIVVDGGKGQLNIACAVIKDLGINGVDVASIAKVREETGRKSREQDIAYIPGRANPITFHKDAAELFLLQRIRDEAHRFAIEYHKKLRAKQAFATVLEDIPGVGRSRRITLLKHFGSVERIAKATPDEIAALTGINVELGQTILEHLRKMME